jgi:hypothetical protein
MKLSVSEILGRVSNHKNEADKIRELRANNGVALHTILRGAFDPTIKWLLPEGEPPYKPNDLVDQQHIIYAECRKFYLFIEGGNPNLKQLRREQLFVEMLEMIDPEDAKLLVAVKDKHMPYTSITIDLINKAFPGLISQELAA